MYFKPSQDERADFKGDNTLRRISGLRFQHTMHDLAIGTMTVLAGERLLSTQLIGNFTAVAGSFVESFEAVVRIVNLIGRLELPSLVFRDGVLIFL